MIIFPAIDIKDKKCVRLTQGDFDKVNVYGEDPSLNGKKMGRLWRRIYTCCKFKWFKR